ncbi:MAG: RNA 2',3'-cyclic phosphodiesterase [Paracoccaceae bacterium]
MIRAFVGLPVPDDVSSTLEGAQVGLRIGNLVPRENFHLTLAFLGEHPGPVVEDIHDGLSGIDAEAIAIEATGMDIFGSENPRALFADVVPVPPLKALRKKVRQTARDYGVALESCKFHPHITLARFGRGLVGEDVIALGLYIQRNNARARMAFTADRFCLYRSYLGAQGPIYEVLAEYALTASTVSVSIER